MKVLTILGTRPELIRLSLIVKKLDNFPALDLIIINPDGKSITLNNALTIQAPLPPVTSGLTGPEITSKVKPSVVLLETASGHGSGFIIDSDGHILTNAHVVKGYGSVSVQLLGGSKLNGAVIGRNEIIDLAVVKISASDLVSTVFGDSDELPLPLSSGVRAFGYPLSPTTLTVEQGEVTARRVVNNFEHLQISANIQPGNSGGPLANNKAEVVGINSRGVSIESEIGSIGIGINFAIPINVAKQHLASLKSGVQILKTSSTPTPSSTPIPTPSTTPTPTPIPSSTPTPVTPGTISSIVLVQGYVLVAVSQT